MTMEEKEMREPNIKQKRLRKKNDIVLPGFVCKNYWEKKRDAI